VKKFVVVCVWVAILLVAAAPLCPQTPANKPRRLVDDGQRLVGEAQGSAEGESPFVLAERSGEPSQHERTFFVFSTSAAKYILRHDGFGEVTSPAGLRRVFAVKVGAGERIERVYSLEYEGDLLLLYQAGETGYLARISQKTRKMKAVLTVNADFVPPALKDHRLIFSDGAVVSLN
jgi:hypothetical protein